jgi:hypothetical protein
MKSPKRLVMDVRKPEPTLTVPVFVVFLVLLQASVFFDPCSARANSHKLQMAADKLRSDFGGEVGYGNAS